MKKFNPMLVSHIVINDGGADEYSYLPERRGNMFSTYKPEGYYRYGEYEREKYSVHQHYFTKDEIMKEDMYYLKEDEVYTSPNIEIYVGDKYIGTKYFKDHKDMLTFNQVVFSHLKEVL